MPHSSIFHQRQHLRAVSSSLCLRPPAAFSSAGGQKDGHTSFPPSMPSSPALESFFQPSAHAGCLPPPWRATRAAAEIGWCVYLQFICTRHRCCLLYGFHAVHGSYIDKQGRAARLQHVTNMPFTLLLRLDFFFCIFRCRAQNSDRRSSTWCL